MRIAMFNNEFPPLGGGTGTVNQEILHQFAEKHAYEIDLFTSAMGKQYQIVQFSEHIRLIKVPVNNKNIHHSTGKELILYTYQSFWKAIKEHNKKKYNLSMSWSTVPAGWNSYWLKKVYGVPYIIRVTGPDIPYYEKRYDRIYPILTPIIKLVWSNASKIVAKCQTEKDMVRKYETKVGVQLIYNAIDNRKFLINSDRVFTNKLTLICVARLIKRKGQETIIYAIHQLLQQGMTFYLNLVGTGDDEQRLRELVSKLNINHLVTFSGYIPRDQISRQYDDAQIFTLPSYNEGMSNALLEAMASGLPVLVTQTGGTDELVRLGKEGFIFQAGKVQEAVVHLRNMYENRELLMQMSKNVRRMAEQNSWENASKKYELIFQEIARP